MEQANGLRPLRDGESGRLRTPTVHEALQFTPLSSILPFNTNIIPFPRADCYSASTTPLIPEDSITEFRNVLEADAQAPTSTSRRLQYTLQRLQDLLSSEDITSYKFKRQSSAVASHTNGTSSNGISDKANGAVPGLSKFANMVLQSTNVAYRYPTPTSPESDTTKRRQVQGATSQKQAQLPAQTQNQQHYQQNASVSVQETTQQNALAVPFVVIPAAAPSSQRGDYAAFPDIDANVGQGIGPVSKWRRTPAPTDASGVSLSIDERELADVAVANVQNLLADIFEAEDQLQPDTSGAVSVEAAQYFIAGIASEDGVPTLTPTTHIRVSKALQKAVSHKRFAAIPVELLLRLQKLCESALRSAEGLDLDPSSLSTEDEAEQWARRVQQAENALQASKISLRIMTAGREDKQLQSEELLRSVIQVFKESVEACIVRTVESRNTDSAAEVFKALSLQKQAITSLLITAGQVLKLVAELLAHMDVAETDVNAIQDFATRLLFVENAHAEKDSILGVQRFESFRRVALDVVASIFSRCTSNQRRLITNEILTHLGELPVTRQSARQFRVPERKSIQLVSALLMQLVQTCATISEQREESMLLSRQGRAEESSDEGGSDGGSDYEVDVQKKKKMSRTRSLGAQQNVSGLHETVQPLHDSSTKTARYIINFLVGRALTSTKTGDSPYRNLLDIFTEDFLNVLGLPEWPGAQQLLHALVLQLVGISQSKDSGAPSKNMALDVLGNMASGISELQISLRSSIRTLDTSQSETSATLSRMAEDVLEDSMNDADIVDIEGPFRMVVQYLSGKDMEDFQSQSAYGHYMVEWAGSIISVKAKDHDKSPALDGLATEVNEMMIDPHWLRSRYKFEELTELQARLASAVVALTLPFCRAYQPIFGILLSSITSDQATVKSKGLKSITTLLEKDPSILEKGDLVMHQIFRCMNDPSPLVRDSALSILAKCMSLKPKLEEKYERIVQATADPAIGVRKRAMKILKDIYLRNQHKHVKSTIAEALLQRTRDSDEGVADIARQTLEEMWFTPYVSAVLGGSELDIPTTLALKTQVSLVIKTLQRGDVVANVLESLLQAVMSNRSKTVAANFRVCEVMVDLMFEGVIDVSEIPDQPPQAAILQTLTVFAKANPRLFKSKQLELLQPYVENLTTNDDLQVYRSVIVIFRCTFPELPSLQEKFLRDVQNALFNSVSRLTKTELNEVASCLWTIDGVLKTTERLIRLMVSVLRGLEGFRDKKINEEKDVNRVRRFMTIAAYFGKYCNFNNSITSFRNVFKWWKGLEVAGLIVDLICPFTSPKQPPVLRQTAIDSIGVIASAWPKQYLRSDVNTAFKLVFEGQETQLEALVFQGFKEFFAIEEKRSETGAEIAVGEGAALGAARMNTSLVASDNDGVSTSIAQVFLSHLIRIALETHGSLALLATQVIASINRQGLVHPKECGPALVALETSPNAVIAKIAFEEHRSLHHKYESMFEREYMKAIQQTYTYQRDVVKSPHGYVGQPPTAKLKPLFEILKTGNSKVRKKFLSNLCSRLDFELPKLDVADAEPSQLAFVRFCAENLALFEYARQDELLNLLACLEKIVSSTGTVVAHAVETDLLKIGLGDGRPQQQTVPEGPDVTALITEPTTAVKPAVEVDQARLRHLTTASVILHMLWETRTQLRRTWGLQRQARANDKAEKSRPTPKDLNKAPVRTQGITPDSYLKKIAELMATLDSPQPMLGECQAFVKLLSLDDEVKLPSEDEEAEITAGAAYETPSEDEEGSTIKSTPAKRGRKRKSGMSASNIPQKPRKRGRPSLKGKETSSRSPDDVGGWD